MIIQIIVFSINSCVFQPQYDNVPNGVIYLFEVISAILAFYFLLIEIVTSRGVSISSFTNGIYEIGLNFLSPILILLTQIMRHILSENKFQNVKTYYWELLAWTSFFLWLRFLLMLRSVPSMSPAVSMVMLCIREIRPYLMVVAIGCFAFSDAFQSINQIAYRKASAEIAIGDEKFIQPPYYKNMEVTDYSSFFDKYFGEFAETLKYQFIYSVIGFEGEGIGLWSEPQWILYTVCIIFNAIVLMNILLALVGEIFSEVHGKLQEYTYLQLVNQICLLQRIIAVPIRNNSLKMLFIASQRKDISEADNENKKKGADA